MNPQILSSLDAQLVLSLQKGIPIVAEPFATLAIQFKLSEQELFAKIADFRAAGIIRRLGAVFNVSQLGYQSALCGIAVPVAELDAVAQVLIPHPGITHIYSRSCALDHSLELVYDDPSCAIPNLWFTLSTLAEAFDTQINALQNHFAYPIRVAPATRKFKVQVVLDPNQAQNQDTLATDEIPWMGTEAVQISLAERKLVTLLHGELPLVPHPFAELGAQTGFSEQEVLEKLMLWKYSGALRRIAILTRHQKLGFTANAMCTWSVPAQYVEAAGLALAACREVTHCYERTTFPGFAYNIFAMIHAKSPEALLHIAEQLSERIGTPMGRLFFSCKEYKKSSLVPFQE